MRLAQGLEGAGILSGRAANEGSGETDGRIGVIWTS